MLDFQGQPTASKQNKSTTDTASLEKVCTCVCVGGGMTFYTIIIVKLTCYLGYCGSTESRFQLRSVFLNVAILQLLDHPDRL